MYSIIQAIKLNKWVFGTKGFRNFLYVVFFLLFVIKGVVFLDPDFGWRLKAGETYLFSGIPATDPFTYTMPSFPWVDHAWLQSAFFAFGNNAFGIIGLSAVYSIIAFCALAISFSTAESEALKKIPFLTFESLGNDLGVFGNFIFLLCSVIVFSFFGIRAQIISWLMFAILLKLLFALRLWIKWRKLLPVFFLIWANLHGSFSLGIFVLFTTIFIRAFRKKHIEKSSFLIAMICLIVTFINPYGTGVWREVFSSVMDSNLRWSIAEWMPSLTMASLSMAAIFAVSASLVWRQRRIFKPERLILFILLLLQAISSRRHLPLWIIFSLPMTTSAFFDFYNEISIIKGAKKRFKKAYKFAWALFLLIFLTETFFAMRGASRLNEENFYPRESVIYLKNNLPEGNIFSDYGWGGYLIWKLPEKKVFIDGRMPSWRWQPKNEFELESAFDTYNEILAGDASYAEIFARYDVDAVLWPAPKEEDDPLKEFYDSLENFLALFGREKNDFSFLKKLESDGWNEVYKDDVAVLLRKPS